MLEAPAPEDTGHSNNEEMYLSQRTLMYVTHKYLDDSWSGPDIDAASQKAAVFGEESVLVWKNVTDEDFEKKFEKNCSQFTEVESVEDILQMFETGAELFVVWWFTECTISDFQVYRLI